VAGGPPLVSPNPVVKRICHSERRVRQISPSSLFCASLPTFRMPHSLVRYEYPPMIISRLLFSPWFEEDSLSYREKVLHIKICPPSTFSDFFNPMLPPVRISLPETHRFFCSEDCAITVSLTGSFEDQRPSSKLGNLLPLALHVRSSGFDRSCAFCPKKDFFPP